MWTIVIIIGIPFYLHAGALAVSCADQGEGVGPIFLDNVECTGNESTLLSCESNPPPQHNCVHGEDAGVMCRPGTYNYKNRIAL